MISYLSNLIKMNIVFLVSIKFFYWYIIDLRYKIKTKSSVNNIVFIDPQPLCSSSCSYQKIFSLSLCNFSFIALTWSLFAVFYPCTATELPDGELDQRRKNYEIVSKHLASIEDEDLSILLQNSTQKHSKWGKAYSIELETENGKVPIFIKTIPLTEREAKHVGSTENLFELPLYYHYGVGSAGFGSWRELSGYRISTNWVLTGGCQNFPLVYHYRVMSKSPIKLITVEQKTDLQRQIIYWEKSSAISTFLIERQKASSVVVILMEYIPETLETWLENKFTETENISESDLAMIDSNLKDITNFINSHGMLHFDIGFRNILTDGKRLYLADFGLAISKEFNLSQAELKFFEEHSNYDRACAATRLINSLIIYLFGEEKLIEVLQEYAKGQEVNKIPNWINLVIIRDAPIAQIMNNFFQKLRNEKKETLYPQAEIDELYK